MTSDIAAEPGAKVEPPRVRAPNADGDALARDPSDVTLLANAVIQHLRKPPYFAVLTGTAATEGRALSAAVLRAIAMRPPVTAPVDRNGQLKLSFTRVQINPDRVEGGGASTSYSRTSQPLALHTDSSYKPNPHELIAFQMVRSAARGGETLMATAEAAAAALTPEHRAALRRPVYPFGHVRGPILSGSEAEPTIRYYRAQLDASLNDGAPALAAEERAAIDALDAVLARAELGHQFPLAAGETAIIHNLRALHGRTGFEDMSDRLMYRFRINAGGLG